MKKIKIMLTVIIVMAVVGGALAFKATKFNSVIYCDTQANPGLCTVRHDCFSILPLPAQESVGSSTCTTTNDVNADCEERPTYTCGS